MKVKAKRGDITNKSEPFGVRKVTSKVTAVKAKIIPSHRSGFRLNPSRVI